MYHLNDLDVIDNDEADLAEDPRLAFTNVPTPFEQIQHERDRWQPQPLTFERCEDCQQTRVVHRDALDCPTCSGVRFVEVPTADADFDRTKPGSEERIAIMAARYRAGFTVFP